MASTELYALLAVCALSLYVCLCLCLCLVFVCVFVCVSVHDTYMTDARECDWHRPGSRMSGHMLGQLLLIATVRGHRHPSSPSPSPPHAHHHHLDSTATTRCYDHGSPPSPTKAKFN